MLTVSPLGRLKLQRVGEAVEGAPLGAATDVDAGDLAVRRTGAGIVDDVDEETGFEGILQEAGFEVFFEEDDIGGGKGSCGDENGGKDGREGRFEQAHGGS